MARWVIRCPTRILPLGTSLVVQWLRIHLAMQGDDAGSIPGQGTKISHAAGQLSLRATAREPTCRKLQSPCALEPVCHS